MKTNRFFFRLFGVLAAPAAVVDDTNADVVIKIFVATGAGGTYDKELYGWMDVLNTLRQSMCTWMHDRVCKSLF